MDSDSPVSAIASVCEDHGMPHEILYTVLGYAGAAAYLDELRTLFLVEAVCMKWHHDRAHPMFLHDFSPGRILRRMRQEKAILQWVGGGHMSD